MPSALPSFSPAKGTLLHRQLFLVLRDQILRGLFDERGILPKEEDLCEHFSVSRITVRRALADLAAAGLVQRRHGLGTFVRKGLSTPRPGPTLSLVGELTTSALETDVKVLKVEREEPPKIVAGLLKIDAGTKAVHALRLRSVGGTPVMLTDAWVPLDYRHRVTVAKLRRRALYEILLDEGTMFGRVVQEFSSVVADPPRANFLEVEAGAPLLRLERLMHDQADRPILYIVVHVCSERSRVLMDIPGEAVNTLTGGRFLHDV